MSKQANAEGQDNKRGWRLATVFQVRHVGSHVAGLLRAVGPVLAITLVIGGFGVAFAYQAGHLAPPRTADSSATTTAIPSDSATAPSSDTPTAQGTNTPATATATSQVASDSSPTASSQPVMSAPTPTDFQLTSVMVTADPADNFTHTCAPEVFETFTMTITAVPHNPGETVSYGWGDVVQGSETQQHKGSLTFAPGQTTQVVTFKVGYNAGLGDGSPEQDTIWVTYPEEWMWPGTPITHATVAFTCVRQLTSLTLTSSISAWNAPCGTSTPVTMTWTVAASPGPRILADFSSPTYSPGYGTWLAPGGFQAILPPTIDVTQATTQASGSINTSLTSQSPNGTYWMQVATTSPTALTAKATLVKNC